MDFIYQFLQDIQDPIENFSSIAGALMIATITYIVSYVSSTWALAHIIITPYLYLTGRRTAKKHVNQVEGRYNYDYRKASWLHSYLKLREWKVDINADKFTWGRYFTDILQVGFGLVCMFAVLARLVYG